MPYIIIAFCTISGKSSKEAGISSGLALLAASILEAWAGPEDVRKH